MKTALATTNEHQGLTPSSVAEAQAMAETLSKSVIIPEQFKGKPSDIFMVISYGIELGMPPVTSLMSIAVIKGRPTLYANTMAALVLSSGKAKYFRKVESSATKAIYETLRVGDKEPRREQFTIEDAKQAGLSGDNWKKYPRKMLEARAKAFLARDAYPDILHGMISAEEAEYIDVEESAFEPSLTTNAEEEVSVSDQMLSAQSLEELQEVAEKLKGMDKGDERTKLAQIYKDMKDLLGKSE